MRQYVSVQRAAQILDCSQATVRRWLDAGVLTGRRFGRTWRVDAACLESSGGE
ncbi:MAG: helix-turn-helix domain-containing protein [Deltaproteobacteria bacterium]|nr:helix-turn-helix domain-containing protein [Deltaproteobacteria bacterium]